MRRTTALLFLAVALAAPSQSQSNQFRDTRAHLGVAAGLFTFHGPIDLSQPRSRTNFVREHDPAVVFLASFPIVGDLFFFRGLVALTNFNTRDGRRLVGEKGKNEFLTKGILLFEPEIVMTLRPGSKSRVLPYIFTGFGGTIADAFGSGSKNQVDLPGTGVPGPERSVYHLPIGAGVDVAFNECWSAFGEASYRWDLNYVWRNESNYDPHNTSLVMGGFRMCVRNPFKKPPPPPPPLPPPMAVPSYEPPLPRVPRACPLTLGTLNPISFDRGSTELSAEARELLNQNVEALKIFPTCCVQILGYTNQEIDGVASLGIAQKRAEVVRDYYIGSGLTNEQFTLDAFAEDAACPKKGKDGVGGDCPDLRRVESAPIDCTKLLRGY